jgi:DNA-binding NarL/FixJ family response regulator
MRCLVADAHPVFAAAVCKHLGATGYETIGPLTDGQAAVAAAANERPALAVVDHQLPRLGGACLVRRLAEVSPETRIAVYTADADEAIAADLLACGGAAVILKEAPLDDLGRALESVAAGRPYVDPALARDVLASPVDPAPELTSREANVLLLLADGLSNDEIGDRLSISGATVRVHVRKATERLGASTRTQAVATALRLGLIE